MKKVLAVATLSLSLAFSSMAITKSQAVKEIQNYLGGSNHVSKIVICETKKYFIGEALLEGYENLPNTVRKVYVNKKDGTIIPTMSEHSDYCYMLKK